MSILKMIVKQMHLAALINDAYVIAYQDEEKAEK